MSEPLDPTCPKCGAAVSLTPKRRVIATHRAAGIICPGTGMALGAAPHGSQRALVERELARAKVGQGTSNLRVAKEQADREQLRRELWRLAVVGVLAAIGAVIWAVSAWQGARAMDAAVANGCDAYVKATHDKQTEGVAFADGVRGLDLTELNNRVHTECTSQIAAWEAMKRDQPSISRGVLSEPDATPDWGSAGASEVERELAKAGVQEGDVNALAAQGRTNNYLPASAEPADEVDFAYMILLECRDVQRGTMTWDDSRQKAVATGASASDARSFTGYMQTTFCPVLH